MKLFQASPYNGTVARMMLRCGIWHGAENFLFTFAWHEMDQIVDSGRPFVARVEVSDEIGKAFLASGRPHTLVAFKEWYEQHRNA